MKSLSPTTITFFVIGFIWTIVAIAQKTNRASFLSMGVTFIVVGLVFMSESKNGGKK